MQSNRLFFIDAMRAWAILMMLQGHFIDGLLDPIFRNPESPIYSVWLYFRGITAPVFFTVSGFIFTYLLIRVREKGMLNPRVKKGIRRGLQLILIGYLLRLNLLGLFKGEIYDGFYLVDVLHCIGLSILAIIGVYLFSSNKKFYVFPVLLTLITLTLFLFEPLYKQWSFSFLPSGLANYFTKANGSVFTIIPWLGYTSMGAALSMLFFYFKKSKHLYTSAIALSLLIGLSLIYLSSPMFMGLYESTKIELFQLIFTNNYLFIRMGDVLVVFAVFMLIRRFLTHPTLLKIGSSTLSIYIIHFIILYGSFTGLGLYKFFHHELSPGVAVFGALVFMIVCMVLSLVYGKHEVEIKDGVGNGLTYLKYNFRITLNKTFIILKEQIHRIRVYLIRFFASVRN